MLTPDTIGILAASAGAGRFARRHPQRWLIIAGFLVTVVAMALLLALVRAHSGIATWIPGLLLFGIGVGVMLRVGALRLNSLLKQLTFLPRELAAAEAEFILLHLRHR